jgi:hypothetical protein
MPEAEFTAISHGGVTCEMPDAPAIPTFFGAAADPREVLSAEYKTEMKTYNDANYISEHLVNLILKAVPEMCIAHHLDDATHGTRCASD